jgi:hypothetical protein
MSGSQSRTATGRISSLHARRKLSSEIRRLRRSGLSVLVIEPVNELSAMVVDAALDGDRATTVLTAAFVRSANPGSATRSHWEQAHLRTNSTDAVPRLYSLEHT